MFREFELLLEFLLRVLLWGGKILIVRSHLRERNMFLSFFLLYYSFSNAVLVCTEGIRVS